MYGVEYLRSKLSKKRYRTDLRYRFYEMKEKHNERSFMIPPWLKENYRTTVGWCTKAVDSLADRLVFEGFENDYYGAMQIFDMNNPDIFFDSAIRESLIGACAFVHIAHGENVGDVPRLSVLTAKDATGIMDEQAMLLKEGYAVLDRDKNGSPILEAYYTTDGTQYFEYGQPTLFEPNPARYPLLVPIVYRPSSHRPFGHSRISRACMDYQNGAERTLQRSDVSAEFYSFPQKYVSGTDPDADPLDTWQASMSAMLRFDKDESGDKPQLGQFSQQSMSPYTEQLRTWAAMFSGETGLTLDDLGFPTDNPSSAEAIKAAHETLRQIVRKSQRTYGIAFANVGFVAASVRDDMDYSRSLISDMKPIWIPAFEPDAAMISAIGDGAIKMNQAVPNYFTKENLRMLTGIESGEAVEVEEEDV